MIAINMKMPSCCAECDMCLCLDDDYSGLCSITQTTNTSRTDSRNSDCPLIEIVTCEGCKHNAYETKIKGDESIKIFCRKNKTYRCIDGFCSDGERREQDED
jgi:hypothetical protein